MGLLLRMISNAERIIATQLIVAALGAMIAGLTGYITVANILLLLIAGEVTVITLVLIWRIK